jgi:branched-chain amino acid transport system substrate-binding protein
VGLANAFAGEAEKAGIKVLGHDQLDPREADYTTILTKIKALAPQGLYYGGVAQAGVKVIKQSYDIVPSIVKGGGDGIYAAAVLSGAGFPAVEGWYATIAAPHVINNPALAAWVERFTKKFGKPPEDYSITAYDAARVILDAVGRVAASGQPITRAAVRDAIQTTRIDTLQGPVSFDANGDIENRIVSVFKVVKNPKYPLDDVIHQFQYMGVAPQTA